MFDDWAGRGWHLCWRPLSKPSEHRSRWRSAAQPARISQHYFFRPKNLALCKRQSGGGDLNSHPWGMGCQLLRNGAIEVLRRVLADACVMLPQYRTCGGRTLIQLGGDTLSSRTCFLVFCQVPRKFRKAGISNLKLSVLRRTGALCSFQSKTEMCVP